MSLRQINQIFKLETASFSKKFIISFIRIEEKNNGSIYLFRRISKKYHLKVWNKSYLYVKLFISNCVCQLFVYVKF